MVIFHSYVWFTRGYVVVMFYPNTAQTPHKQGWYSQLSWKKGVEATNLDELEFSRDDSNQYSFAKRSQRGIYTSSVLQSRGLEDSGAKIISTWLLEACGCRPWHGGSCSVSAICRTWRWRQPDSHCHTPKDSGNSTRFSIVLQRWQPGCDLGAIQGLAVTSKINWRVSSRFKQLGAHLLRSWRMGWLWLGAFQVLAVTALKSKINSRVSSRFKQLTTHLLRSWRMGQ